MVAGVTDTTHRKAERVGGRDPEVVGMGWLGSPGSEQEVNSESSSRSLPVAQSAPGDASQAVSDPCENL